MAPDGGNCWSQSKPKPSRIPRRSESFSQVPTGALGAGVRESDVAAGMAAGAHAIACDAGSTDTGLPGHRQAQVLACRGKSDLTILVLARRFTKIVDEYGCLQRQHDSDRG